MPADAPIGDRRCMAFSGTFVTGGRATGVVVATGTRTELGAISELIAGPPVKTPLELLTARLEKWIGIAILAAVVFTFGAGLLGGYTVSEMFRTAVALSVASIPESLPIILTVAMSVGVARMAKRHAIVRTLPAVETLGSTTVIASDKTGTLTQNKLTVERVWTVDGPWVPGVPAGPAARAALRAGVLTNEAKRDESGVLHGDAVDVAMAEVALAAGAAADAERAEPPLAYTPYEPALRYSQAVRRDSTGRRTLYVKGQPDIIAGLCGRVATGTGTGTDEPAAVPMDSATVMAANDALAAEGLRVLAAAHRVLDDDEPVADPLPAPHDLVFLGLEGMTDPPREGVARAVADCRQAGIAVTMITGDQPATAEAIARRLGLDSAAAPVTGAEMAGLDDDQLADRLAETSVAARVSPHDKLRIVGALQARGEVVAVTGDGVNDAPALKAASIGVAMGRDGTDVAREAADVVLTDDDFVTIVDAVEQGRVTFSAIRKATFFLLSTAVAGVLALSVNVLLDQPLLFLPVQILWINLVTSGIQDVALALEPAEGDELKRKPRPRSEGVLSRTLWVRTFLTGAWMGALVLAVYGWALSEGSTVEHARTMALTTFVLFNFVQVGNARTEHRSLLTLSPLRNKLLVSTAVGSIVLLWAAMSWSVSTGLLGVTPLSLTDWVSCGLIALTVLVLVEADKLVRNRIRARRALTRAG
ncbi:cation-translocating P-type ATPase [Gordonia iterans]|uniref:cation-translocating P-type ATPase n=1 Tax=Gordonia iterans TaxID=1004901 RepID=UPI00131E29F7|nr:HAD-IC family P-type ATPase [Gordonia iterans]